MPCRATRPAARLAIYRDMADKDRRWGRAMSRSLASLQTALLWPAAAYRGVLSGLASRQGVQGGAE